MADELVLGTNGDLLRPDALEDFGASNSAESGVSMLVRGRSWAPAGESGEAVMRRLYVEGYHRAALSLFVTPVVDGRFLNELRAYLFRPAPASGRLERFSFIVPLGKTHPDFPGQVFGLRGTVFDCYLESSDPAARFFVEGVTFAPQAIASLRARTPEE